MTRNLLHGWLLIDKPAGPSSAQVVGKVKWLLKPSKIGHAGTLDPLATGLLPLALGEATKTVSFMLESDKAYDFTLTFGAQTSTNDSAGDVVTTHAHRPTEHDIRGILRQFTGPIQQIPPAVSALKIDGERAYKRVRAGEDVILQPRPVTIHALALLAYDGQNALFSAHVSKGTYIRSLARDMALALGTVGHVSALRRTKHGPFEIGHAMTLETLDNILKSGQKPPILPVETALHGLAAVHITPAEATALRHGKTISLNHPDGLMAAYTAGVLAAIIQVNDGLAKVERGFNLATSRDTTKDDTHDQA